MSPESSQIGNRVSFILTMSVILPQGKAKGCCVPRHMCACRVCVLGEAHWVERRQVQNRPSLTAAFGSQDEGFVLFVSFCCLV